MALVVVEVEELQIVQLHLEALVVYHGPVQRQTAVDLQFLVHTQDLHGIVAHQLETHLIFEFLFRHVLVRTEGRAFVVRHYLSHLYFRARIDFGSFADPRLNLGSRIPKCPSRPKTDSGSASRFL